MKMMKENRGLTLVELLITIAILSIVVASATSFMITGSKSFTKGNADSELQREAELTVNQVEDMVIDTNGGLTVEYEFENPGAGEGEDKGAVTRTELTMYHAEKETDETGAEVLDYVKESVVWNPAGGDDVKDKIYYSKWNVSYDSDSGSFVTDGAPIADNQLLAERVSLFEVDTDTEDEMAADGTINTIVRSVQIRVGYENSFGRVEYATSPIITLRNRMLLSADPNMLFEVPEKVDANFRLYYKSEDASPESPADPIIDRSSTVQRGSRYQIYAYLTNGNTDISDLVNWKIEESETCFSSIDAASGKLNVDPNEPCEYLSVTATYKSNPAKKATGVLKVEGGSGKSFTAINITTTGLEPLNPTFGSYPTFEGPWTAEEMATLTYEWTVVDHPDWVESFDGTGKTLSLTVKPEAAAAHAGEFMEIKLTAHTDVTGETRWDVIKYRLDKEKYGGDSFMRRGLGLITDGTIADGLLNFTFDTDFGYDVICQGMEYYFCNESGNRLSSLDGLLGHVHLDAIAPGESNHHFYYRLTYDEGLPLDQAYNVKVIAYMKDPTTGTEWKHERIFFIPAVEMYNCYRSNLNTGNNRFDFVFGLVGYYSVALGNSNVSDILNFEMVDFDYELTMKDGQGAAISPRVAYEFYAPNIQSSSHEEDMMKGSGSFYLDNTKDAYGNDYGWAWQLDIQSVTVKVSLKQYPDIYTLITIYRN